MAALRLALLPLVFAFLKNAEAESYAPIDAYDPRNIDMMRQALLQIGVDPHKYEMTQLFAKYWIVGWSYKATLRTRAGRNCFFTFDYNDFLGVQSSEPPICEKPYGLGYRSLKKSLPRKTRHLRIGG